MNAAEERAKEIETENCALRKEIQITRKERGIMQIDLNKQITELRRENDSLKHQVVAAEKEVKRAEKKVESLSQDLANIQAGERARSGPGTIAQGSLQEDLTGLSPCPEEIASVVIDRWDSLPAAEQRKCKAHFDLLKNGAARISRMLQPGDRAFFKRTAEGTFLNQEGRFKAPIAQNVRHLLRYMDEGDGVDIRMSTECHELARPTAQTFYWISMLGLTAMDPVWTEDQPNGLSWQARAPSLIFFDPALHDEK